MTEGTRQWFYMAGDQRRGPVPEDLIRGLMRDGVLESDCTVWTEGMPAWEPASVALPRHSRVRASSGLESPQVAPRDDDVSELPEGIAVFFPVSTAKFVVMSMVTFGLYELYWSYRNWKYVKQRDGLKIMPFWRAWFTIFFFYDLARGIKQDLIPYVPVTYSPGWLTLAYVLLVISGRLPAPFGLVAVLSFLPMLPLVQAIEAANVHRVPEKALNARFTRWNIAGIVLFALLVVAFLVPVPQGWLPS